MLEIHEITHINPEIKEGELWFTVEEFGEWETAYLLSYGSIYDTRYLLSSEENLWEGKCLKPNAMLDLASRFKAKISLDAWRMICGRYIEYALGAPISIQDKDINSNSLANLKNTRVWNLHKVLLDNGYLVDALLFEKIVIDRKPFVQEYPQFEIPQDEFPNRDYFVIENPIEMAEQEIREKYWGFWVYVAKAKFREGNVFIGGVPVIIGLTEFAGGDDDIYDQYINSWQGETHIMDLR